MNNYPCQACGKVAKLFAFNVDGRYEERCKDCYPRKK